MKRLMLIFGMVMIIPFTLSAQAEMGFVCGPCGCSFDNTFFDDSGLCEHCGMESYAALKDNYQPEYKRISNATKKTVAILLFERVQIIDYTGPYEVFGQAGWDVYTVAERDNIITTAMGMKVKPHYTFENAPEADILVLPGGGVNMHLGNEKVMSWIKERVENTPQTLSVCNGAFFLGKAGLLDGRKATTFNSLIPKLQELAPNAEIVKNERFVDTGTIVTSAGLSSGIDGALHVVSKYQGIANAQRVATNLEYNWDPNGNYVRAALADELLSGLYGTMYTFDRELIKFEGDREHWEIEYLVNTDISQSELIDLINFQAEKGNGWNLKEKNDFTSLWSFTENDDIYEGRVTIKPEKGKYRLNFKVEKSNNQL